MFGSKKGKEINLIQDNSSGHPLKKAAIISYVVFGIITSFTFIALITAFFISSSEKARTSTIDSRLALKNTEWQKVASSAAGINLIKSRLKDYQTTRTTYHPIENYIQTFAANLPASMTIVSLDIDSKGKASIQVKAPNAEDAYQFADNLRAQTASFSDVTIVGVSRAANKPEYTLTVNLVIK